MSIESVRISTFPLNSPKASDTASISASPATSPFPSGWLLVYSQTLIGALRIIMSLGTRTHISQEITDFSHICISSESMDFSNIYEYAAKACKYFIRVFSKLYLFFNLKIIKVYLAF